MPVIRDIVYGRIPGTEEESCRLDLYLPNDISLKQDELTCESLDCNHVAESAILENHGCRTRQRLNKQEAAVDRRGVSDVSAPFVLFLHGGGWRRGGKNAWRHYLYQDVNFLVALIQYFTGTHSNVGTTLANNGIMCALVSYPLTEVGVPFLLFEMMMSYLQCTFVMSVLTLPILVTYLSLRTSYCSHGDWDMISPEWSDTSLPKVHFLAVLLCVNIGTLYILTLRRNGNLKATLVTFISVLLPSVYLIQEQSYSLVTCLLLATVLSFVYNQTIIARNRLKRRIHTSLHQSMAVAMAVKWARQLCQMSNSRLYLMGHSSGGHLVTRTVLDDSILRTFGCSTSDIAGVIAISGVYDLLCLKTRLLRTVYLLPTFGEDPNDWFNASPTHIVQTQQLACPNISMTTTRFLLLSAMTDPLLKKQSSEFYNILRSRSYDCKHIEIPGTNHFSIITGYKTGKGSTLGLCVEFLLT